MYTIFVNKVQIFEAKLYDPGSSFLHMECLSLAVINQHIEFFFCIVFIQFCYGSCVRFRAQASSMIQRFPQKHRNDADNQNFAVIIIPIKYWNRFAKIFLLLFFKLSALK